MESDQYELSSQQEGRGGNRNMLCNLIRKCANDRNPFMPAGQLPLSVSFANFFASLHLCVAFQEVQMRKSSILLMELYL